MSVGAGPQHEPTDAAEEWAAAQAESGRPVATAHDEPQQLSFTDEDRRLDDNGADVTVSTITVPTRRFPAGTTSSRIRGGKRRRADISDVRQRRRRCAPVDHGTIPDEVDDDEWAIETAAAPTVARRSGPTASTTSICVRCPGDPVVAATTRRPRRRRVPTGTGNGGASRSCCSSRPSCSPSRHC